MGKRELLLVVGFLLAGAIVYQATAPPPAPGERSFSWNQVVEHFRQGFRANRASAELLNRSRHDVDPAAVELKIAGRSGAVMIVGQDRPDIEAELLVRSNGEDEDAARRLAGETHLEIETAGTRLSARIAYPEAGTQRALRLTLKVPARLHIIVDDGGNALSVTGVAAVDLSAGRGEVKLRDIAGAVSGVHRGGEFTVVDSGSLRLESAGSDLRLQRIAGDVSVRLRGGELRASTLGGAIEIDAQGGEVSIDQIQKARGPLQVTATGGSVAVADLQVEAHFDVRDSDVRIDAAKAAPLTITSQGHGAIEVTPAAGGYELDASTAGGELTLPDDTLTPTMDGQAHHAAGPVRGGGPLLRIRTRQADIVIRSR